MRRRKPIATTADVAAPKETLYEREARSVSKLAHLRFFPLAVTGGKGATLRGDDGRIFIDFSASWGAASLGHSHPAIRSAVDAALRDQAGASYLSSANLPAIELAEMLLDLAPARAAGRVWLGHSGSDANETTSRVVRAVTGRPGILAFKGAYHGGTSGSMAFSGHPSQQEARSQHLTLVPYPTSSAEVALRAIDEAIAVNPNYYGAFFIEPIQSDGGMLVPPPGFFEAVQRRCRDNGILLISDDVKVGIGRTGVIHAFQNFGIEPDVLVLGKGLGGGLPISAVIGPEWLMNDRAAFSFQTLHGNPVCAAAAAAVLRTIEREKLLSNSAKVGYCLKELLSELALRQPAIAEVRGIGLALGIELRDDALPGMTARELTARVVYRAFQLGLVVYYVGVNSNVIEVTPPLNISHEEARRGVEILERAIEDIVLRDIDLGEYQQFGGW
ncbi:aminotransferase class III-fold pyridoxal phosphate-dependent enzyme [Rhizobium sp. R693]|uniref:aspartate aminotransferase family protein n=1 Tax=Rhizobium sp. R693 TaxID=1764276 RepID=UPI001FD95213|nr:aminotransferase class III-fold pyridoxal phosphate-dependent enzyme [Rhizobium sp. R693]